jgi:uncharacterized protein (DUF2267 family)
MSGEYDERAARAVLQTLAERISAGQARDLVEWLPPQLAPWLHTVTGPEPFDVDEFLRRVAAREGVDVKTAERDAKAVFYALGRLAPKNEIDDLAAELPQDFAALVAEAEGQFFTVMPAEEFLGRVAERAGLDANRARLATDAVLETLAERIAAGEVDDLIAVLPLELHPPLRRGRQEGGENARRMSLEQFVSRVAKREAVSPDEAREHARAVFETLREAIPHKEFLDVTAQLPHEYAAVAANP